MTEDIVTKHVRVSTTIPHGPAGGGRLLGDAVLLLDAGLVGSGGKLGESRALNFEGDVCSLTRGNGGIVGDGDLLLILSVGKGGRGG